MFFLSFFDLFHGPDNEHMCKETDFAQEKGSFLDDHLQKDGSLDDH